MLGFSIFLMVAWFAEGVCVFLYTKKEWEVDHSFLVFFLFSRDFWKEDDRVEQSIRRLGRRGEEGLLDSVDIYIAAVVIYSCSRRTNERCVECLFFRAIEVPTQCFGDFHCATGKESLGD